MKHQKRTFCSPFVDKKHHEDGQRVDERLPTDGFICNLRVITIKSKETMGFVVVAFSLKIWVAIRFTPKRVGT